MKTAVFIKQQLAKQNASVLSIKPILDEQTSVVISDEQTSVVISDDNVFRKTCNITSGPYQYNILFDNVPYQHAVNINRIKFLVGGTRQIILFISTGHSFASNSYITDTDMLLERTGNINDLFQDLVSQTHNRNLFFSTDNNFNDIALILYNCIHDDISNFFIFNGVQYKITGICQNLSIHFLVNCFLLKKGFNTGEIITKPIIDFRNERYLETTSNNKKFFTFRIGTKIIVINTIFNNGIITIGTTSRLQKYNGIDINQEESSKHMKYYFYNLLKDFFDYDLFKKSYFDPMLEHHYINYLKSNSISIVSLMGDSGSGYYRLCENSEIEFVGINICGCSLIILSESPESQSNDFYFDSTIGKLKCGKYIIEQVHKAGQILPHDTILNIINEFSQNSITYA